MYATIVVLLPECSATSLFTPASLFSMGVLCFPSTLLSGRGNQSVCGRWE